MSGAQRNKMEYDESLFSREHGKDLSVNSLKQSYLKTENQFKNLPYERQNKQIKHRKRNSCEQSETMQINQSKISFKNNEKNKTIQPSVLKNKTIIFGLETNEKDNISVSYQQTQKVRFKEQNIFQAALYEQDKSLSTKSLEQNRSLFLLKKSNGRNYKSISSIKHSIKEIPSGFMSFEDQKSNSSQNYGKNNLQMRKWLLSTTNQTNIVKSSRLLRKESQAESINSAQNFISSKLIDKKNITFHNISQSLKQSTKMNTSKSLKNLLSQKQFDSENFEQRKVAKIGQGAHATVFKLKRDDLGVVVLKRINQMKHYDMKEIQMMEKCVGHPFIAQLQGVHYLSQHSGNMLGLFLEYYPSGDLRHKIWEEGTLSFPKVKIYAYQILRGLHYLHNQQIMHRDIKSQNIFLRGDKVVIGDLGSAKFTGQNNDSSTYVCIRSNRAPELALEHRQYDQKVDIWAVGCIIVQMILGRNLFEVDYPSDLIYEIIRCRGSPPSYYLQLLDKKGQYCHRHYYELNFQNLNRKKWSEILEETKLPENLQDFLEGLFEYEPSKRLSAVSALQHQYFADIRDQTKHKQFFSRYQLENDFFTFLPGQLGYNDQQTLVPAWWRQEKSSSLMDQQ